ncbi:unnamed protein product [Paramecium sonneborni]|uniref:Uncharacterized protein n=1 Tax=Paramecium sonneborni TaxID=65129 RepID=A0A8S1N2A3_9CILI|nr:unnamed protein product [Paramecium sonneborni]
MAQIGAAMDSLVKIYNNLKQRNTGEVVDDQGCKKMVYTFVKQGQLDGPGKIVGKCGTKKDHARVFCCQNCFSHYQ